MESNYRGVEIKITQSFYSKKYLMECFLENINIRCTRGMSIKHYSKEQVDRNTTYHIGDYIASIWMDKLDIKRMKIFIDWIIDNNIKDNWIISEEGERRSD